MMETYFAPAERASEEELKFGIEFVSKNPIVDGLLQAVSGLLAVLDEHRQVVALNASFLEMLEIDNPEEVLGLRPGEALQCIYAEEEESGCGTTRYCSTCGAAISIVSSLIQDRPVERICALTANRGKTTVDLALSVRSYPIKIQGRRFVLLFLQDITLQQQRAALERTFFHDVNNMLSPLVVASEMLLREDGRSVFVQTIHQTSLRLLKEVAIQSHLSQSQPTDYQPMWHEIKAELILEEVRSFFANHPVAYKKNLIISKTVPTISINTDASLLLRVVYNMIINALEATEEDGNVRMWLEREANTLSFCVWNAIVIPEDIARRIFQRNFSTKNEAGRGVGSYSMKLFGEKILGGQVSFTTSKEEGTVFRLSLPLKTE